jgi:hypothetical protein
VVVAGYLTSGILTLVIPLGLVLVIGIGWTFFVRTHRKDF